ncbi:MAG: threonine-phosphate decarboxylase [Oscillospiraceae bacterium]|nr:threonine-phosphate decarboxylase [Oscillospiraceae bacterium]
MNRKHGGDCAAFEREYGFAPLDFSANVSPLGVPESVREAIAAAAAGIDRYPDPECRALRRAIAEKERVPAEWLLCGGGAADLIWRAALAVKPKRAIVTAPCFGEYEAALEAAGCEIVRFPLAAPFEMTDEILCKVDRNTEILILCNPNNPTGRTVEPVSLRRIIARCRETGTRLLLDECFADFLDEPEAHTMKGEAGKNPHLLLVKAFTKFYGMAGARLGYALCADTAFLDAMRRAGPPWSVSSLAQAAGLAALREDNYVNRLRALIKTERPRLAAALCAMGLRVVPGEANFLLFRSETPLETPLRERGILIRGCADFAGLDETWYRAAVRTREDNDRLIAALKEAMA